MNITNQSLNTQTQENVDVELFVSNDEKSYESFDVNNDTLTKYTIKGGMHKYNNTIRYILNPDDKTLLYFIGSGKYRDEDIEKLNLYVKYDGKFHKCKLSIMNNYTTTLQKRVVITFNLLGKSTVCL